MDPEIEVWTLFSLLNICNPKKVESLAIGQVSPQVSRFFIAGSFAMSIIEG